MNEDKATRFHRLRRRTELAAAVSAGTLMVLLLLTGAAAALAAAAARVGGAVGEPPVGRAFAIAVMVLGVGVAWEAATFPWAFFRGFVLERRYGRSHQRLGDWLRDHVTALALGLLFAVAGGLAVYGSLALWPDTWWLPVTAAFGVASLALTCVAPMAVMPLFYRFTPGVRPALRERLLALARRARTPVLDVYQWHLGAKSRMANAALVGMIGTRRILVSDTLLEAFSDEEIEVILAHELAHHVHRDLWSGLLVETARTGVGLFVAHQALRGLGPALGLSGPDDLTGVPLVALAVGVTAMLTAPLVLALSRAHERRADRFALECTGNSGAFVSAMKRLGVQNLAEEQPSRFVEVLFHTHPPLHRRLAAARAWRANGEGRRSTPPAV